MDTPKLWCRRKKDRTPEGMEPLGDGRWQLKHTHVRTQTDSETDMAEHMSNILIRLMRPFTRLTEEVLLNS